MGFDWNVWSVDGHDEKILCSAITSYDEENRPTIIVADTIKGKGVSDVENDMFAWHHRAPSEDEYKKFIREIDES